MALGEDLFAAHDINPMNTLFEINHPGQVHLLRNTIWALKKRGHKVGVIAKDDALIKYLLDAYGISYTLLGRKGVGVRGKLFHQILFNLRALRIVYGNRFRVGVGSSITNDHVSFLSPMNSIHLSDDDPEIVPFITKFSYPFSAVILSPGCLCFPKFDKKHIGYAGYHELAYLHPSAFRPDAKLLKDIGLGFDEKYFVMRFVALKGHHDAGHVGLTIDQKKSIIEVLSTYGRVFITSENKIEAQFEPYRLPVPPDKIHSLMSYATMFLGDSQTMTSEAAVLGTPAIKCNSFAGRLSVPNELEERYGLCYSFQPADFHNMLEKIKTLLKVENLREEWRKRRDKMLSEKIDVSAFFVWFIENYPSSVKKMRENPDYQWRFK